MTKQSDPINNTYIPDELIKLGTFEWPRSEARQTLCHLFGKIKGGLMSDTTSDVVDDEELKSVSDEALKKTATQALTMILGNLLDRRYLEWSKSVDSTPKRCAFVHPPMTEDTLHDWAVRHGLPVLDRAGALGHFSDATCIVIPKLEAFFSRDYGQMAPLFDLFNELAQYDGNILVGCNSWAWRFLKQFDDVHLLFEAADTFPAFDADALLAILERARSETENRKSFKSVASGAPILLRDNDGALKDPYLKNLASLSLGHPWVALEMFFRGIAEIEDSEDIQSDGETWVNLPVACSLPAVGADALWFALQALMIHGARPTGELNELLPHRMPNGTWTELARLGFVELIDGRAHCAISHYPDIRSELGAAGFNLDEL